MKLQSLILSIVLLGFAQAADGQTTVIAKPLSDQNGNVVFHIVQVVRIDGHWANHPHVGQVLYPSKPTRAYPIARFGESVLVTLPEAGSMEIWQGVNVHNGYIPALKGIAVDEFVQEVASRPNIEVMENKPAANTYLCRMCNKLHIKL